MYEYISGKLNRKKPDHIVIDCSGVGYRLKVTFNTYQQLPAEGETVMVYAYLHVREDIQDLYGFAKKMEREFFYKLIGISKIGPKAALAILSAGSPADISNWVLSEDAQTIAKTPGIGPTTAKRIILELKPKIEKGLGDADVGDLTSDIGQGNLENEAIMALEALGYVRSDVYPKIRSILKENPDGLDVEQLIKQVLKK
ncbi:MAG: Holliday junction branch migration protein RuvA [Candidatus Marinimicrobia bacterium]|nr:Holliday junction branch migration protein RuvA [Candidatus Neomarinimicrobiota bacterium]MCF7850683.1 Holliday junction branch migration protein RuvA [Candidatus Neomarinimicrobiota bacterium]MCF7905564.1 Holliday junction branch migration protein RuvA [Candidatus Neomarinimicrobiota bacterium]